MKNIYFYFDIGEDHWEIGRTIGPAGSNGKYPFELLVAGFMPDEEFLWSAKYDEGLYVDKDHLSVPEKTDKHAMISMIFEDKAYWILDKWRNTKDI